MTPCSKNKAADSNGEASERLPVDDLSLLVALMFTPSSALVRNNDNYPQGVHCVRDGRPAAFDFAFAPSAVRRGAVSAMFIRRNWRS